ncbi:MAG: TIR domain-containing protein [Lachnospiraceae bacterium]|nr:TIR domain-containing protein [Lachnospiraceae bacterium]
MNTLITDAGDFLVIERDIKSADNASLQKIGIFGDMAHREAMLRIAEDILSIFECAVYVSKGEDIKPEDVDLYVKEFSLIVFAVSDEFLSADYRIRTDLFPRAYESRIPILPIQIEGGEEISRKFTDVCGSIHLLSQNSDEYPENLKSFINTYVNVYHLIGLSAMQKNLIRNLFSFKAFVSYRKKDRAAMMRLLSFIRSIPELFDMAIFFDDALTPGEDYNDRLAREIDEAAVIFFAVTPNMLEDGNYVIREEYPQAVEKGKILIPILMEDMAEEKVNEAFPAFERIWTRTDADELRKLLLLIKESAGGSIQMTEDRLYFLGHAYAKGDGTEHNMEIANTLFSEAAKAGHHFAMAKVAEDLYLGRRSETYEHEREECLEYAMHSFVNVVEMRDFSDGEPFSYGMTLAKLSDMLYNIASHSGNHEGIYESCISLSKANRLLAEVGAINAAYYAAPWLRLGEMYLNEGNLEDADHYLTEEEKDITSLLSSTNNSVSLKSMLCRLRMLQSRLIVEFTLKGDFSSKDGQEYSNRYLEQALSIADELHETEEIKESIINYARGPFANGPVRYDFDFSSIEELKALLDKYTKWYVFDLSEAERHQLFEYRDGFLPEGIWGESNGNYVASSYKCYKCNSRLYMVEFHPNDLPVLDTSSTGFFTPGRVFTCPECKRYFAAPCGKKFVDGPIYQASPVVHKPNEIGEKIYGLWLRYFNVLAEVN